MAFVDAPTRGSGRRRDVTINLVPYIDMLMTLMAFLVVCAAWTQISALDSRMSTSGSASAVTHDSEPIVVELRQRSVHVDGRAIAADQMTLTAALRDQGTQLRILVEDGVPYGRVVEVVDTASALKYAPPSIEPLAM